MNTNCSHDEFRMTRTDARQQCSRAAYAVIEWLVDDDIDTLERLFILFRVGLAFAVLVLSSRIIATPPPYVRSFALVLPAWMWASLIFGATAISVYGRIKNKCCYRRDGAVFNLLICGALAGPLWLKGPGLCLLIVFSLIPQAVLAVRLKRLCADIAKGQVQ